ncbi:MAG: ribonuclease HII [Acidiphilium sp.]|nr:ribonuclease HII [Acidiphilium sp.]MDD4934423.1 ribonuclease HII [Acidiphilium sp.]
MPDFIHERRVGGIVAGVDEVGRGPLAGPVLAAAVILPFDLDMNIIVLIDDSKRLSAQQRCAALTALTMAGVTIALGAASVDEIVRLNILQASLLAMRRAVVRLPLVPDHVLVDGNIAPGLPMPCSAIIGGDGISLSIAAASIAAKVARDGLMTRLDGRHPGYGWARNAGYGTRLHRDAIGTLGATPHHRPGFGPLLRDLAEAR